MKPLTYFIENDFSSAVIDVYGQHLELLRDEIAWLSSMAANIDDYDLALLMHHNSNLSSYTKSQQVLFRLGLDIFESENNLARFHEILQEYA